jgi:hypothetical protein
MIVHPRQSLKLLCKHAFKLGGHACRVLIPKAARGNHEKVVQIVLGPIKDTPVGSNEIQVAQRDGKPDLRSTLPII